MPNARWDLHTLTLRSAGRYFVDNVSGILAIEWPAASQGVDFRAPLKTSEKLQQVKSLLREKVSFYDKDRYFSPDIEAAKQLIKNNNLMDQVDLDLI